MPSGRPVRTDDEREKKDRLPAGLYVVL